MRLRFIFNRRLAPAAPFIGWLAIAATAACSSSEFSLGEGNDAATVEETGVDSGSPADTGFGYTETGVVDAGPVDGGSPCAPPDHSTTAIYVNASAPDGGNGSIGCPFKTLAQAAATPLGTGVMRSVWVHAGNYTEAATIRVRTGETYRTDGSGVAKLTSNASVACATADTCAIQLDANSALDGLTIEGGTAAIGIVSAALAGVAPSIKSTTVRNMPKDGVVVMGVGAQLGPDTHVDGNGWSGLMIRNGKVIVSGAGNTFDGNKGGTFIGSTFIPGSGIHVRSGAALFVDGGTSTSNNAAGVFFDAGGGSGTQTLSQVTAVGNRGNGVVIAKGWQVTLRKVTALKNGNYGLMASYDTATRVDIGDATSPGNNTFGTAGTRNGKAGIFLCRSQKTGSQPAESNSWGVCPPVQTPILNCDTAPTSYVDIAYVPDINTTEYVNPVATPVICRTSG